MAVPASKKRILILSAAYPPHPGGVATHVANLAYGLQRDGSFHISVIFSTDEAAHEFPNKKTINRLIAVPVHSVQYASFSGRRVPCQDVIKTTLDHLKEIGRVDIIHAHDFDSLHVACTLKYLDAARLVLTYHRAPIPWREHCDRDNPKDCYLQAMRRNGVIDAIAVPSQASRDVLASHGFNRDQIHCIPHGISSRWLRSFDNDQGLLSIIPDSAKLIFCPSRDDTHKDNQTFISAARHLSKRHFRYPLVFWMASDSKHVERMARRSGFGSSQFIARSVAWEQMATLYRRASVCVVPSRRESFGQTVLESFVHGTPVVASNTTALREIVRDGENGLLFTDGEHEELADRIQEVLTLAPLRRKCIGGGLHDVSTFYTVERMTEAYKKLYYKLL